MRVVKKFVDKGMTVTAHSVGGVYRLPPEIPEGAAVKVVSENDHGNYEVEYQGKHFRGIFLACLDAGEDWYPDV